MIAFGSLSGGTFPDRILTEDPYGRLYVALQTLRGRPLGRLIRRLQGCERLGKAEFDRRHGDRLAWMLAHARAGAPLYRDGPWRSARSDSAADLATWPVLDRSELGRHGDEFGDRLRALPARPWHATERTSGSTGARLRVALTPRDQAWRWAQRYRALLWHGIPLGVRTLRVSATPRPLRDLVLNQKNAPKPLSPETMDEAAEFLRRERPGLVFGPPSALFRLARHLGSREGAAAGAAPAAFARVGGEQLYEFQRLEIERWLGGRVVNSYGCTEVGPVAAECPSGSLHVLAEHVHLEILRGDEPAPPGETGDVVLTGLRNTLMPLVRCRVGDRGSLSADPCACGLPHPVLAELQARRDDTFLDAGGRSKHVSELAGRLGGFFADPVAAGVLQVLFGRVDATAWRAWVEVPHPFHMARARENAEAIDRRLTEVVRRACGDACRLETRLVTELPRNEGKFAYLTSGAAAEAS